MVKTPKVIYKEEKCALFTVTEVSLQGSLVLLLLDYSTAEHMAECVVKGRHSLDGGRKQEKRQESYNSRSFFEVRLHDLPSYFKAPHPNRPRPRPLGLSRTLQTRFQYRPWGK